LNFLWWRRRTIRDDISTEWSNEWKKIRRRNREKETHAYFRFCSKVLNKNIMMAYINSELFLQFINIEKLDLKDFEMKRIYLSQKKIFSRKTLLFRFVQANVTPTKSFSFFFLYYYSVQRERERTDIPPAHKHVDRLI